jgi:phosphoribosylamine--glycine ligase
LADYLGENGVVVFGPSQKAAMLESSKDFAKVMMSRTGIPTASYKTFDFRAAQQAHEYIDSHSFPVVLKADGLAAGKGVVICRSAEEAHSTLDSMFEGMFGESGRKIVIEDFLSGEEASILAICDGEDYVTLAPSQDHKRALDGDMGMNTGGMGAYAPAAICDEKVVRRVSEKIIRPMIKTMADSEMPFVGCLYAGLMIKDGEPSVVEFNVRFGDPEAQAVLSVFEGDLASLLYSAAKGNIDKSAVADPAAGHACCVVLASEGYPGKYEKGFEISGIDRAEESGATVYHAGTKDSDGKLITAGGRVLGVTGRGDSLKEAIAAAYHGAEHICFDNKFYRNDIGAKGVKREEE